MTSERVPVNLKAWLCVIVWTVGGAVIGTVIAYVLFGLVWTNWDVITGAESVPTPRRNGGDPIDNWANGVVGMLVALPVVLGGFIAGSVAGFHLGRRRHQRQADGSAVCRISEGPGDVDVSEDAIRSASHDSRNSGNAGEDAL